jgi:hypothetical protein
MSKWCREAWPSELLAEVASRELRGYEVVGARMFEASDGRSGWQVDLQDELHFDQVGFGVDVDSLGSAFLEQIARLAAGPSPYAPGRQRRRRRRRR